MSKRSRARALLAASVLLTSAAVPAMSHAASAAVDTAFGAGGETTVQLNGGWSYAADAVRTPDDGFVVAGSEEGYGLAIAKFTASGALDLGFDGDGIATLPVSGASSGPVSVSAVTADGAGNVYVAAMRPDYTAGVYKFSPSGTPVAAFGGAAGIDLGSLRSPGGLRLSPDGSRLYAGLSAGDELQVHALDPATGATLLGFGGGDGIAELSVGSNVSAKDLVVRPTDGKIFVAGTAYRTAPMYSMIVARFGTTGAPDLSFSGDGFAEPFLGFSAQESSANDLFALADGDTYVVGHADGHASLAIARVNDDGSRDGGFGNGGLLTDYASGTYAWWDGVNVQQDGHVVVTGGRHAPPGASSAITRRYTAAGQLDSTFADGGSFARTGTAQAFALVAQTSGSGRYVSTAFEDDPADVDPSDGTRARLVVTGIKPNLAPTGGGGSTGGGGGGSTGGGAPAGGGSSTGGGSSGGATQAPAPTPPAEKPVPEGCTRSVIVGPLEIKGDCLKREGMTWTTSASASVGGLKFVPNGASAKLIVDPLNLRIATSGAAKIVFEATVYGRTIGPVKLYEGSFDWTFQYKPDLRGLARLVMPQPGSGGPSISLNTLKGLPGLSGVGSLPKVGGLGLPDFSKLSAPDVAKLAGRIPSLRTGTVQIPLSLLNVNQLPELRFQLPSGPGALLGLPVQGEFALKMAERGGVRGVDTTVNLALPAAFGGISGASKMFIGVNGQVQVDALGFSAEEVTFPGLITAKPIRLAYQGSTDTWTGETKVYLGFKTSDVGIGGRFEVQAGKLKRVAVSAAGIPLGGVATFDDLTADLTVNGNKSRLLGSVNVGFGPKIPALNARAVAVDGSFDFDGERAKLGGNLYVANIKLASASAKYTWDGYFSIDGKLSYFLDSKREYGFEATINGEASSKGFNAEGSATFKAKGNSLSGKALVSSVGVAGCASIKGFLWRDINLGAGYKWNAKYIDWIGGSCDFSPYRAKLGRSQVAQRLQAAGAVQQLVGKDQDAVAFKVLGTGAAPQFTLTGPDGSTVSTPADGSMVVNDRFVVVQQPADNATYVAIARPKDGAWSFAPAAGSTIAGIEGSEALPKPEVKAQVRKANGKVTYEIKTIPGQTVRFLESGNEVSVELGSTSKGRGSFSLQPNAGKGGKRTIEAIVEQDGMVRDRFVVATYTAKPKRLAAPKVKVKRGKGGLARVSWKSVKGSSGYRATVTFNGRTEVRTVDAKTRKVEVPGLLAESGLTAKVIALGGPTREGKVGKATLKKPKTKARKGGGKKK